MTHIIYQDSTSRACPILGVHDTHQHIHQHMHGHGHGHGHMHGHGYGYHHHGHAVPDYLQRYIGHDYQDVRTVAHSMGTLNALVNALNKVNPINVATPENTAYTIEIL